jgi:tetratricopeptide (TPR) repeat protein
LFICLSLIRSSVFSQSELSASAYTDYMAGNLDDAINNYNSLISSGHFSADIYYNLGCIYLNQNNISMARLNFEKALRLNPASIQIKNGIARTKSAIEPSIDALPPFILYKWFLNIRNLFSSAGWGWLLLISIFIMAGIGILKLQGRLILQNKTIYLLSLMPIFFTLFYISRLIHEHKRESILILNQGMHVAPDPESQVALPLGAGTKVLILDSLSNWYKVNLENNDEGWLPKVALEGI